MTKESKQNDSLEIVVAQWQTCVEMANAVSERRDNMNNLFISINLAIVAATSFILDLKTVFLLAAGILDCVVWLIFINNYRNLNKAKFEVINKIERNLPVKAFSQEWDIIQKKKKYKESTKLEFLLPVAFIVLYVAFGIFVFLKKGA